MPFRSILTTLLAQSAAPVRAAVFCDEEGERVEAIGNDPALDEFEIDLRGASYAAIAAMIAGAELGGGEPAARRVRVLHERDVIWLQGIARGYYLLVLAARNGHESALEPLLDEIAEALLEHM